MRIMRLLTTLVLLQPAVVLAQQLSLSTHSEAARTFRTDQVSRKFIAAQAAPRKSDLFSRNEWPAHVFIDDLNGAYNKAIDSNLPLMILFAGEWCSYCRRMQTEALAHPAFAAATRRSVFLVLDVEKDDQYGSVKQLILRLGVEEYPTFVVMDVASKEVAVCARIVGYHNTPAFFGVLAQVHSNFARLTDPNAALGPTIPSCPPRK